MTNAPAGWGRLANGMVDSPAIEGVAFPGLMQCGLRSEKKGGLPRALLNYMALTLGGAYKDY